MCVFTVKREFSIVFYVTAHSWHLLTDILLYTLFSTIFDIHLYAVAPVKLVFISGGAKNLHLGAIAQGVGPGRSPGRWSGGQSSSEVEAVFRYCLQILTAETIRI